MKLRITIVGLIAAICATAYITVASAHQYEPCPRYAGPCLSQAAQPQDRPPPDPTTQPVTTAEPAPTATPANPPITVTPTRELPGAHQPLTPTPTFTPVPPATPTASPKPATPTPAPLQPPTKAATAMPFPTETPEPTPTNTPEPTKDIPLPPPTPDLRPVSNQGPSTTTIIVTAAIAMALTLAVGYILYRKVPPFRFIVQQIAGALPFINRSTT